MYDEDLYNIQVYYMEATIIITFIISIIGLVVGIWHLNKYSKDKYSYNFFITWKISYYCNSSNIVNHSTLFIL